jgi:hypothetical protein
MTLLDHQQPAPRDSATIRVWSLTLPYWAGVQRSPARTVRQPQPATWTCARCGSVVSGAGAAAHHVELHRLQESLLAGERRPPGRSRGRRHSASRAERERGAPDSSGGAQ